MQIDDPDRRVDARLQVLIDRHRLLDNQADILSARRNLSPSERQTLKELKVLRLRAKDAIVKLEKELVEAVIK
jgi:uncharacterized protein YdcH (DUF465 family)